MLPPTERTSQYPANDCRFVPDGLPRYEQVDVPVETAEISADRKSISLTLLFKICKNCIVYYSNAGRPKSADGKVVERPEARYAVQRV